MEPTEEVKALANEFRVRWHGGKGFNDIARHVLSNFTRNVPVVDDEVEALADELYRVWRDENEDSRGSFSAVARHVLSRPAPPGTIRLGTGLTEAQRGWDAERKKTEADAYASAAKALEGVFWEATAETWSAWEAFHYHLRRMATDLRASAEPPPDQRIAVVQAELRRFVVGLPVDAAPAILAALDKMGGAGG